MTTTLSHSSSNESPSEPIVQESRHRFPLLIILGLVALLLIALLMRLRTLGVQFDRDSYDEGVYWQTLRSLSSGHPLYSSTFYSQPPLFILSVFPVYILGGQTIWAARFGVAIISLLGLLGAFLLGYAVRGRMGGFVALIIGITSQNYLAASQTLQAEGPQVAFSLLAIAFAYLWWQRPNGWKGSLYAALCTLTLVISIACKLFGLTTIVPIALLALAQLWRIFEWPLPHFLDVVRHPQEKNENSIESENAPVRIPRIKAAQSLIVGIAVLLVASLIILLPFLGDFHALWSQVISFHNAAAKVSTRAGNSRTIINFLLSPLGAAALLGLLIALYRREWLALPLLAWLIASALLLWRQMPLFNHHLVILVPVLLAMSIFAIDEQFINTLRPKAHHLHVEHVNIVLDAFQKMGLFIILCTIGLGIGSDISYYQQMHHQVTTKATQQAIGVSQQLQHILQPGQYVITDAQFVSGLADRNTPPDLVDTSSVHIQTGYLTSQQLIAEAQQPQVQAVLFYTGRLSQLHAFHTWVTQHYRLEQNYGKGNQLWVKIN